jgi:hypothetical protein
MIMVMLRQVWKQGSAGAVPAVLQTEIGGRNGAE